MPGGLETALPAPHPAPTEGAHRPSARPVAQLDCQGVGEGSVSGSGWVMHSGVAIHDFPAEDFTRELPLAVILRILDVKHSTFPSVWRSFFQGRWIIWFSGLMCSSGGW